MKFVKMGAVAVLAMLGMAVVSSVSAGDVQPQTAYTVTGPDLKGLAARLEADSALAEGKCRSLAPVENSATSITYSCASPSEKTDAAFRAVVDHGTSLNCTTVGCPVDCVMTYCPFPTRQCCNIYTHLPCQ